MRSILLFLVALALSSAALADIKVTIASDSTAASYGSEEKRGRCGWGQVLPEFFSHNVSIDNQAASGRSSKTFIEEGRWEKCLRTKADYYFIQFAHNDSKTDPKVGTDAKTTYRANLARFIKEVRAQGAKPVLITPPTRRTFKAEHTIKPDHLQQYADAMREVAAEYDVPLLDVLPDSIRHFETIGREKSQLYQSSSKADVAQKNDDTTHFSELGARHHCSLIVEAIRSSSNPELSALKAELLMPIASAH